MKKTRFLMAVAVAAMALASAAFASPPDTYQPRQPTGFEVVRQEVAKDVSQISQEVATSGQGAQSALKAYTEQRQGVMLPAAPRQISAADLGLELREAQTASALHLHEPGGGSWLRSTDPDGEGSETDIRRTLT